MKPVELKLEDNRTIYSAPPSGCGAILLFILNVLQQNQLFKSAVNDNNKLWQRIVETLKWAYARRTELGDPGFEEMGWFFLFFNVYLDKTLRIFGFLMPANDEPNHLSHFLVTLDLLQWFTLWPSCLD